MVRARSARLTRRLPALALLAGLPLLLSFVLAVGQSGNALYPWADHAVLEIETLNAADLNQELGTYSRYQWSHPGPALFYSWVPLYELLGKSTAALNANAALINLLCLLGMVLIAWRLGGRLAGLAAGALGGLLLAQLGPVYLRDFWVPHVVTLPFGLYVIACAGLAAGAIRLLPLVAVLAVFLGETNFSCAPVVGLLFVIAAALWAVNAWRDRSIEWRSLLWPVGIAVLLAAVMLYPPIHEEIRNDPGNIRTIQNFFKTPDPGHSTGDAIALVSNSVAAPILGPVHGDLAVPARSGAKALLALFMLFTAAGAIVAYLRGRRFAAGLCMLAFAGVVIEVYAATNIRGDLFSYLIQWFSAIAIAGWLGAGLALVPELRPRFARFALGPALAFAVAALALFNVVKLLGETSIKTDPAYASADAKPLWQKVSAYTGAHGIKDPLIEIPDNGQWPNAASVIVQRMRRGLDTSVGANYIFLFGNEFKETGREDARLVFQPEAGGPPKDGDLVVKQGGTAVWAVSPPR